MNAHPVLETIGLSRRFGALVATSDVSLKLEAGARHALIGPNGAGKTTFVNLLTGVISPSSGQIFMDGEEITNLRRDRRVRKGLVRTFQINQLFARMTPAETLGIAISEQRGGGWNWLRGHGTMPGVAEEVAECASHFGLYDVIDTPCRQLPYGKQRLLEIALAVACKPRVLLLDEPAAGVPEGEREEILARLAALPSDVAVLLIEHDMDLVFNFALQITVLVGGAVFADGCADEILSDPRVRAVYLGEDGDA